MRVVLNTLRWLLILALLLIAANLKDPHLLPLRPYVSAFLVILSILGLATYFAKPESLEKWLGLCVLTAVLIVTVNHEIVFEYHKNAVLTAKDIKNKKLGQHFIVGYKQLDDLKPLVNQGLIGGIFITKRNAEGKTISELRNDISVLQAMRKAAGLPKLIIATDQEGGTVSRLSPPLVKQTRLSALANENAPVVELQNEAETYGKIQGAALADIGVNLNFSPVVDLRSGRAANSLDFHSHINQRAISADPVVVSEVAKAYVQGLTKEGVTATLKHFPGLGWVTDDTHYFSASLDTDVNQLDRHDWLPFKRIARETKALIMLSHVLLTQIDDENPVSFSKKVVQTIIRENWKFDGILISDDLTMAAAYNRGLCDAAVKALNAGVDLLLIAYDFEKFYDAMYCVNRAYDDGSLDKAMLTLSQQRLQQRPIAHVNH